MAVFFPATFYDCIARALRILPNPVHPLVFCFLFVFTIPLAIVAIITTVFALSILLLRMIVIYIDLAVAVVPYYVFGLQPMIAPVKPQEPNPVVQLAPGRRRQRRSSSSSSTKSLGSLAPVMASGDAILSQSVGPARDFEGVGGWRLGGPNDEDASWTMINSRLLLPSDHGRRHQRSLTSGSIPLSLRTNRNHSPEALMNTSKARTPPNIGFVSDGYAPLMTLKKRTPSIVTLSSESSKGSSSLSMKQK